ncbi:ABC transporter permease [Streptomyces sp. Ru62]|uniref:ABC transporter permease n=1 Tax=Streptomyces sp. Ru62 TaxID=2080745 RepID=UPI0011B0EB9B|nr:ABC transporter permease [Streptomyces sp. Ru62]
MTKLLQPLRIVRYSAANALADFRASYTWYSWTFGWLGRMLAQVTFFALLGRLTGSDAQVRFLVIGNAVMTCAVEAMNVIATSTRERRSGTLALLAAAPADFGWVFLGRSLEWPISGAATSLVSLFALGPLLGVSWTAAQVPVVALLVLLASFTTYSVGLFLSVLVIGAPGVRNIVSNTAYLSMMAICGVQVPVGFWPSWLQAVAAVLPLTHALAAVRAVAAGESAASVTLAASAAAVCGAGWLLAAMTAFRFMARRGRGRGAFEFSA